MPKIRKKTVEEIQRLSLEGYTDTEIAEKLNVHRTTAAKYRVGAKPPLLKAVNGGVALSNSAMGRLYQLQGLLGAKSREEAIEAVYADEVAAAKYRFKYEEENPGAEAPKTLAGIIAEQERYAADLKYDLDIYEKGATEDGKLVEEFKSEAERRYQEGYEAGKRDYAIHFRCDYCGGLCLMTPNGKAHKHIIETLVMDGWGHVFCIDRVRYERKRGSRILEAKMRRR